jgi:hypothetical protein
MKRSNKRLGVAGKRLARRVWRAEDGRRVEEDTPDDLAIFYFPRGWQPVGAMITSVVSAPWLMTIAVTVVVVCLLWATMAAAAIGATKAALE